MTVIQAVLSADAVERLFCARLSSACQIENDDPAGVDALGEGLVFTRHRDGDAAPVGVHSAVVDAQRACVGTIPDRFGTIDEAKRYIRRSRRS